MSTPMAMLRAIEMPAIVVLGSGYVGLVASACFAHIGHEVICCDIDSSRIARLQAGETPIFEADLPKILAETQANGRLSFSDDINGSIGSAAAIIIAVGTPADSAGEVAMEAFDAAANAIEKHAHSGTTVIVKSTVPPGTGARLHARLSARSLSVVSNPEFLRESRAVADFMQPDRILIGLNKNSDESVMRALYAPLKADCPFIVTSSVTAELAKYVANSMLSVRLSFINEVADLCAASGADWKHVRQILASDKRIGENYLRVGPGYGGSCLPKDTRALLRLAEAWHVETRTLQGAIASNNERKNSLIDRVKRIIAPHGKTIALLGLAFKADSDDIRESASVRLAEQLLDAGAELTMHDPQAMAKAESVLPRGRFAPTVAEALQGADAAIIMTEWHQYKALSHRDFASMCGKIIIDFRYLYDKETMLKAGFAYYPPDISGI